ncbi:MAG TPA: ATP-binding protein [Anaeromyxobacteraceae bacterium]|nr:ATP-binding protein [Anaeromyxobacteraceae bacterium]
MSKQRARSERRRPARSRTAGAVPPRRRSAEAAEAFLWAPVATALLVDGVVAEANDAFARALGLSRARLAGRRLEQILPPDQGELPTPRAGAVRSYRTHLDGVPARVDLCAPPAPRGGRHLVSAVLVPQLADADTAASRALLALSRGLAEARTEKELVKALAGALEVLFPGRCFCIRLVDPSTLAATALHARGRLRPQAGVRLSLRTAAARRTGLSEAALAEAGIRLTERDEPLFEGCESATAVPLAVGGALFGILDLEYEPGAPGDPEGDAPLLYQLANHAALGIRNLRSLEDANYLKSYLEDLIEHANALILVVNRHRELIVWNAALVKLTGFSREDVVGDDVLDLVPAEERARFEAVLLDGFDEGGRGDGVELRLKRRSGGEVRVAVNTAPIHGASGATEGVIAIGQDLTRIRSLEAAAEHAERLAGIGRLAAGVVHELNNPLTAVTMYSDALLEKLTFAGHEPADLDKLRAIKESALRIQRLARDLTSYARPTGARTEPCSLPEVIEEAERMAKPALKEGNASVRHRFEEVPEVDANRASLVQVFVNLVTNAAQAMKEGGGTIDIFVASDGERVRAVVADDGTGMPPEVERRLFEPFFTTRTGRGIGLGLPIVQGILRRHGGAIAVATAPDRGTTVTVTLPLSRAR